MLRALFPAGSGLHRHQPRIDAGIAVTNATLLPGVAAPHPPFPSSAAQRLPDVPPAPPPAAPPAADPPPLPPIGR